MAGLDFTALRRAKLPATAATTAFHPGFVASRRGIWRRFLAIVPKITLDSRQSGGPDSFALIDTVAVPAPVIGRGLGVLLDPMFAE
jgi:hypothetical protein